MTKKLIFRLKLVIIFTLIPLIASQNQIVQCDFRNDFFSNYACFITDATITSATASLTISGSHITGLSNDHVIAIDTTPARLLTVNFIHPQFFRQFPNLQIIRLPRANVMSLEIENCARVTTLTLNNNLITSIPSGIFSNCDRLTSLNLRSNQIATTFPDSFKGLTRLESLNLGGNIQINILRNSLIDSTNLRSFFLNNFFQPNSIDVGAFSHTRSLTNVVIGIGQSNFGFFEELLAEQSNLLFIDLSQNNFQSVNFAFLSRFRALMDLDLRDNNLTSIPDNAFQNFPSTLSILALDNNQITNINENTFRGLSVKFLHLSGNKIDDLRLNPFGSLQQLQHINLANNGIWNLEGLSFGPNLRTISLTNNNILSIPPRAFVNLPSLTRLEIFHNQISTLNSNSFENCPNLEVFTINDNELGSIEPNFFAQFPRLRHFDARHNLCINGWVSDVPSIDTDSENVFSECFFNWRYGSTTTTTPASGEKMKFSIGLMMVVAVLLVSQLRY
jgi:Leucine-rich repeat (LRR) protein